MSDREFYGAFFAFGAWLLALCLLAPLEMRGRYFSFFAAILSALCVAVAVADSRLALDASLDSSRAGRNPWITASSGRSR